jgi:hypothetical protein
MYGFCVRYAMVEDARNGSGSTTLHNGKGYESAVWGEEEGAEALLYTSRANDNVHVTIRCLHSGRDRFHVQTEEGRKDVYAYPYQVNFYYGEILRSHASLGPPSSRHYRAIRTSSLRASMRRKFWTLI